MIKLKLKRLKKAEENKILKEHEGLYERLVKENYAQQPTVSDEPTPSSGWFTHRRVAFASAMLAVVIFITGGVLFLMPRELDSAPANDAINATPTVQEVSLSTVENALDYSSLNTSKLNVERVNAVATGGENDYFELEIKTFHTLDIIVKVNPDCDVPESMKPSANTQRQVNAHGFEIDYTVTRRRMEDYFSFNTKAVVTTDSEVYYIRYNYSSTNATCELLDMLEACITPKQ